jgi:uncharacterized protein (TIGR02611 family)
MDRKEHQTVTKTTATSSANWNNPSLLKPIRQLIIFILGISVIIVGIAMLVLPGPGTIVIPAGLAILATEFVWARRWLNYLKRRAKEVAEWTMEVAEVTVSTKEPVNPANEVPADRKPGAEPQT